MAGNGFRSTMRQGLVIADFAVPDWIPSSLRGRYPRARVNLGCTPTAIHPWLKLENGHNVFIKRDDQTGSSLSGNKVRKLEVIMADLINKGCDTVITCGGLHSNHCRAVAIVAAQLGLECHLLLRTDITNLSEVPLTGNFLLSKLVGSYQYLVGPKEPYLTHLAPRSQKLAEALKQERNRKPYVVPVGGSDSVGVFGYFGGFDEILKDCPTSVRNIFVACGSGGTLAGLAISNFLTGSKFRIYGISVCDSAAYFYGHVQEMLGELGLANTKAENICHVIDGYKGAGYGISSNQERMFIADVAAKTGIFLDPVYTGKATRGMVAELEAKSDFYDGDSLFLHTGGIFGIFGEKAFSQTSDGTGFADNKFGRTALWKEPTEAPPVISV